MTQWDNFRVFLAIAENITTRKAAAQLNLSHSTVARRVDQLEKDLNTTLCIRVADGFRLTSAGANLYHSLQPIAKKIELLQQKFAEGRDELAGSIKLTLPYLLATRLLFSDILIFQERYPQIRLQVLATDAIVDLNEGTADLAIRFTNNPPQDLVGRKIGTVFQAAYATQQYINKMQSSDEGITWIKPRKNMDLNQVEFYLSVRTEACQDLILSSIELQIQAALGHRGIAFVPCFIAQQHPELIQISNPLQRFDIWLLNCKEQRNNKQIKVLRDFLQECLRQNNGQDCKEIIDRLPNKQPLTHEL